ncbi:uncharacterized protein [Amphiura filiformis]|uniref:uncharacterized protein n=1 Tax=Amphiura filiformis TaxID=82378 RepID=UPI003B224755
MEGGNPGMFQGGYNPRQQEGPPMNHMQLVVDNLQYTSGGYSGYGNQQMMQQQPPMQEPSGAMMSSNYNQHYASHPQGGQGGMMQPMAGQPQPGYMQSQQHRPMAASARLQHQLQQRASMQQVQQTVNQPGMPGGPQGGQPYYDPSTNSPATTE